jgi:hypothetical protein
VIEWISTAAPSDPPAAADPLGDRIATAAFVAGAGFGAVAAVLAPKDHRSPAFVIVSLSLLLVALLAAVWARWSSARWARLWLAAALAALVAGVAVAGATLYLEYGPGARTPAAQHRVFATIWLGAHGEKLVAQMCGTPVNPLHGYVSGADALTADHVSILVDKGSCPSGAGTLVLPPHAISTAKY